MRESEGWRDSEGVGERARKGKFKRENVTVPSVVKARRAGTGRNVILPD